MARAKSGPAAALEIVDAAGKVSKRIELDQKALGGADLWPRCVSADRKYLLAATYREMSFSAGAPGSAWVPVAEKHVLLDLRTGKLVPGFDMGDLRWPRAGNAAVMSPSREVLVVHAHSGFRGRPNKNHGIWAVPFDGGRKNLAPGKGLPNTWAGSPIAFGGDRSAQAAAADRLALLTRPKSFLRAPGPRQLFVFWNSAKPIRAWVSKGMGNEPANVAWSRKGQLLAFTAGDMLYVWGPTAEPGEPKLPGDQKPEVF